jgi:hypothetical protein
MDAIRSLDAETARRRQAVWVAHESISGMVDLDIKALEVIAAKEPALFKKFIERVEEAKKFANK